MTEEQIKKKAEETYPLATKSDIPDGFERFSTNFVLRMQQDAYMVAMQDIEELPKIEGYVARDKDGLLLFYQVMPLRNEKQGKWWDRDYGTIELDECDFETVRWEDEPVEAEMIVRLK